MKVSLVVPVRDEERTIRRLLDSIVEQTRVPDEIVVADAGSCDRTVAIVEEFAAAGHPVTIVGGGPAYPGQARNRGVVAASHDVIAFTDAGIRLNRRWLEELSSTMERGPSIDVVYGTYEPILDTYFKECAALAYVPAPVQRPGGRIRPSMASCLMKKAVWLSVGGFPAYRASEDLIFMEAVERAGFEVACAPGAVAYWDLAPGWLSTFRRFACYSRHNIIAGRARYWHYGVARMYGAALACAVLGALWSPWWLAVPTMGVVARIGKTAVQKRAAFGFGRVLHPNRLLYLGALLFWIDLATMSGAVEWLARDVVGRRHAVIAAP